MPHITPRGVGAMAALLLLCAQTTSFAQGRINMRFQGLQFRAVSGKVYAFPGGAELKGKLLLWYFWTPGDRTSVEGLQRVLEMRRFYADQPFEVVTVVLGAEDDARPVLKRLPHSTPHLLASQNARLVTALGATAENAPVMSLMDDTALVFATGDLKKAQTMLGQRFNKKIPLAPDTAESRTAAIKALNEAIELISKQSNYTKAAKLIESISDRDLVHAEVLPLAAALSLRIRVDLPDKEKAVAYALKLHPGARRKLRAVDEQLGRLVTIGLPDEAVLRPADTRSRTAAKPDADALADRKLKRAQRLQDRGEPFEAYRVFKSLLVRYPASAAAETARAAVVELEAQEGFAERFRLDEREREARKLLNLAEGYVRAGRRDAAREAYGQILSKFSDTASAKVAREALEGL